MREIKSCCKDLMDDWYIKNPSPRLRLVCGYSLARYLLFVSIKLVELFMEMPCWCPLEGHQHGGREINETSVIEFCHSIAKLLL